MALRFQLRTLLTLFLIVVFAYIVIESWNMPIQARLYPWTVGIIALLLLAVQLFREVRPAKGEESHETGADMDFTDEEATRAGKLRALELFGWIYGFGLALWLIGFFAAVPVMIFAYLLRQREGWIVTIAMPAIAGLATWQLFNKLLHLPFPPGAVLEWLGWA